MITRVAPEPSLARLRFITAVSILIILPCLLLRDARADLLDLSIEFCVPQANGNHWNVVSFDRFGLPCGQEQCDHVIYSCKQRTLLPIFYDDITAVPNAQPLIERDCFEAPLRRTAFVINQMGGEVRFNEHTCRYNQPSNHPEAVLVVFSGGGGDSWRDGFALSPEQGGYAGRNVDGENDYRSLENAGIRIVAVKWQSGALLAKPNFSSGWWTRTSSSASTIVELANRPATIARYIASVSSPEVKFGLAGTSAGSLQAASIIWYGFPRRIDYFGLHSGGGLFQSLESQCPRTSDLKVRFHRDTGLACFQGEACGSDYGGPEMCNGCKAVVDYFRASVSCRLGIADETLRDSSFWQTPWQRPAIVWTSFLINSDPTYSAAPDADKALGAVWSAGMMRTAIQSRLGVPTYWENSSGAHGQVMESGHPSFAIFKQDLLRAFSLEQ